ncbi:hypothetical protein BSKO_06451 [Bryopsis sp. KO-2023]|nr:hypothetical protein BSKO_06451 [Bryopsis sp. KO-2023]
MSKKNLDKTTSNEDWMSILSPEEFRVLRMKGTEMPGTGAYNKFNEAGVYNCAGCGAPLFTSEQKFDSGCGWPAFFDEVPNSIDREVDSSMGAVRTEILCKKCGGHLGHEFKGEGFPNPTDIRHCVNSAALKFKKKDE